MPKVIYNKEEGLTQEPGVGVNLNVSKFEIQDGGLFVTGSADNGDADILFSISPPASDQKTLPGPPICVRSSSFGSFMSSGSYFIGLGTSEPNVRLHMVSHNNEANTGIACGANITLEQISLNPTLSKDVQATFSPKIKVDARK